MAEGTKKVEITIRLSYIETEALIAITNNAAETSSYEGESTVESNRRIIADGLNKLLCDLLDR